MRLNLFKSSKLRGFFFASTSLVLLLILFQNATPPPEIFDFGFKETDWDTHFLTQRISPASGTVSETVEIQNTSDKITFARTRIVVRTPSATIDKYYDISPPPTDPVTGAPADATSSFKSKLDEIGEWTRNENNSDKTARLLVRSGTYHFKDPNNYPIKIENINRFHFTGQIVNGIKPRFIIHTLSEKSAILILNSSLIQMTGIDVEYVLDENYGPHIAYRGIIRSPNTVESSELPIGNEKKIYESIQSIRSFDANLNTWVDWNNNLKPKSFAIHELKAKLKHISDAKFQTADGSNEFSEFQIGESVLLMHTRKGYGGGINISGTNSSDVTIHGINLRNYTQMGFRIENAGRGFRISNNRILPADGEILSGRADGIHITGVEGDVIIENNIIDRIGDDGINIRGTDVSVHNVNLINNSHLQMSYETSYAGFVEIGDRVLMMSAYGDPIEFAQILDIELTIVNNVITSRKLILNPIIDDCDLTCLNNLASSLNATTADNKTGRLYNLTRSSNRFIIRNNRIFNNGGRGMLIQTGNGVIQNNVSNGSSGAGLLARINDGITITEGPGPVNLLIENNSFISNNYRIENHDEVNAAFVITTTGLSDNSFKFPQRILVRNNCVTKSGSGAFSIRNAKIIELLNNTYGKINQSLKSSGDSTYQAIRMEFVSTDYSIGNTQDEFTGCPQ